MILTGSFTDYIVVFGAGILLSFTPCVYPVIPLIAGFISGANTKGTALRGFLLALLYVLGMAITYCALAVMAALTGKMFGHFQNNPIILIVVGNILLFFALVMFDMIPLPTFGMTAQYKMHSKNLWTVFLFGMASGLIVSPCMTPGLMTLLMYIASKQNIVHGISLVFVFSYGVGFSLILVGTFSSLLTHLPKAGHWLIRVKQVCGLIILLIAEHYLIKAGMLML